MDLYRHSARQGYAHPLATVCCWRLLGHFSNRHQSSPVQPSPKPPHNNNNNNTIIDYVKASIHLFNDSRNSTTTTTRATKTRPKKESSAAVEGGNCRFSSNANRSTLSEMKRSDLPPRNKYSIAFSWSISVDGWMDGWMAVTWHDMIKLKGSWRHSVGCRWTDGWMGPTAVSTVESIEVHRINQTRFAI